jgi:hypothetical protein
MRGVGVQLMSSNPGDMRLDGNSVGVGIGGGRPRFLEPKNAEGAFCFAL